MDTEKRSVKQWIGLFKAGGVTAEVAEDLRVVVASGPVLVEHKDGPLLITSCEEQAQSVNDNWEEIKSAL